MRIKLFTKIDYNGHIDDYIIDFSYDIRNGFAFYYWDGGVLDEGVKCIIESYVMDVYDKKSLLAIEMLEQTTLRVAGNDETDWKIIGGSDAV